MAANRRRAGLRSDARPSLRRCAARCRTAVSAIGGALCLLGLMSYRGAAQQVADNASDVTYAATRVTVDIDHAPVLVAVQTIARAAGLSPLYDETIIPASVRVTLHAKRVKVADAFLEALRGTGLVAQIQETGYVTILRDATVAHVAGGVTGVVTSAQTQQPLKGALVSLDNASHGVLTDENGRYRLTAVSAGTHVITVRLLGYSRRIQHVVVTDDAMATLDVALTPSANQLDQIIVTGTVTPTARKAVPNAMTVITAQELEERGITHIDQLFTGDVPGLFARDLGSSGIQPGTVVMTSRGLTHLNGAVQGAIKTYVDGVELADPTYLGLIDPRSIERIEILTGPQASTIYGSDAIDGVMQIFTKRGTTRRPTLVATLQSGVIQNNFSSALTPQHDYAAQVSGVEGYISYNAGGSWVYQGPWTPAMRMATTSGYGGVRFEHGPMSVDLSLRRVLGTNWQNGDTQQGIAEQVGTGILSAGTGSYNVAVPTTLTSSAQTLGLNVVYTPMSWWSMTATAGSDGTTAENTSRAARYYTPADSLLTFGQSVSSRTTFAYSTTVHVPLGAFANAVLSAGADGWHTLSTSLSGTATALTGSLNTASTSIFRQPSHDHGAFFQGQIGVYDQFFITYGLRAEWNPLYGRDANPNVVPRYGVAYTRDLGPLTAKIRASVGHSTRPPTSDETAPTLFASQIPDYVTNVVPYWGDFAVQLYNPDLVPEQQHGDEEGVELYFGNRASLVVTRYHQIVDNLILNATIDSLDLLPEYVDIYGHQYQLQTEYINLGKVRNSGWEATGTFDVGPVTLQGTYSWTLSRILGFTSQYNSRTADAYGFIIGDSFGRFPEHTYAFGARYNHGGSSFGFNLHGRGSEYVGGSPFDVLSSRGRFPQYEAPKITASSTAFRSPLAPHATADINASQRLSASVQGLLQIQNLGNTYVNDLPSLASIGRQTKVGLRVQW